MPLQRVQGTICGGSGSAERMRIVPRPRQVGHWEGMGLLGCVDADRAACSRAGRVVNFRQCHGRPRAIWFCVRLPRIYRTVPAIAGRPLAERPQIASGRSTGTGAGSSSTGRRSTFSLLQVRSRLDGRLRSIALHPFPAAQNPGQQRVGQALRFCLSDLVRMKDVPAGPPKSLTWWRWLRSTG